MNAYVIIKNIIAEGIDQCKEPIWERLLMPDFDLPNPKNDFISFDTPEEWLDSELHKLTNENRYFEIEYYASKPLLSEEEYSRTKFSHSYMRYAPDYFEFKKRWEKDYRVLLDIEIDRNVVNLLLDSVEADFRDFKSLNLSSRVQDIIECPCSIDPIE